MNSFVASNDGPGRPKDAVAIGNNGCDLSAATGRLESMIVDCVAGRASFGRLTAGNVIEVKSI